MEYDSLLLNDIFINYEIRFLTNISGSDKAYCWQPKQSKRNKNTSPSPKDEMAIMIVRFISRDVLARSKHFMIARPHL